MINPMLAETLDKARITDWSDWFLEKKFDGERRISQITASHIIHDGQPAVRLGATSWTRPRKHAGSTSKTMAETPLPPHVVHDLVRIFGPGCIIDGELMNGITSTDVRRTDLKGQERYVVFDILRRGGGGETDITHLPNVERRRILEEYFGIDYKQGSVELSLATYHLTGMDDVAAICKEIWSKPGGEGVMLKRKSAPYAKKRSRDWIKIKKEIPGVGTVIGFEATKGDKLGHGVFAVVLLETEDGRHTKVKTLDDAEREAFEIKWKKYLAKLGPDPVKELLDHQVWHPDIGRRLKFTFNDYTPKGGLRHPMWDRWEDE